MNQKNSIMLVEWPSAFTVFLNNNFTKITFETLSETQRAITIT